MTSLPSATLFLLAFLVAGCTVDPRADDADRAGGLLLDGRRPCNDQWVTNCSEADGNPSLPWKLSSFHLQRAPPRPSDALPTLGLEIVGMRRGIVAQDFSILGFDLGIRVNQTDCHDCKFEFTRGRIEAGMPVASDEPCPTRTGNDGIDFIDPPPRVVFSDVTVEVSGGGAHCFLDPNLVGAFGGSSGIIVRTDDPFSLQIDNVSITARLPSPGTGIRLGTVRTPFVSETELDAAGLKIFGFSRSVWFSGQQLNIRDSTVECGAAPLRNLDGSPTVDEATSRLRLKLGVGLWLSFVNNSDLQGVSLRGCLAAGIAAENNGFESFGLRDFNITASGVGLLLGSNRGLQAGKVFPTAEVENGRLGENLYAAAYVEHCPASFQDVDFRSNGLEWERAPTLGIAGGAGGLVSNNTPQNFGISVSASLFEGNIPWGVVASAPSGASSVDARDNWWGDPGGPRVRSANEPGAPALGPMAADAVGPGVAFAPYRTSP